MSTIAQENSLFEIDQELDSLLEEIEERAEEDGSDHVPQELIERFQQFCHAHGEKVDRIGHFLTQMEARAQYCREQASRLSDRARSAENKTDRTKNMLLYYLRSRELRKIEGMEYTLRMQKNSQDSVLVSDEPQIPITYKDVEAKVPGTLWQAIQSRLPEEEKRRLTACIRQMRPNNEAIKAAVAANETVPGAEVRRGFHVRVA